MLTLSPGVSQSSISSSSSSKLVGSHLRSSSMSVTKSASDWRLGCGGGGEGLETLVLTGSRLRPEAAVAVGGGIKMAALLELDVASKGCLDAGLFEVGLTPFDAGVAEALRDSPIVMRMNSLKIPSSLYVNCIGLVGREYKVLTSVLAMPACVIIDLKSLTLMTM
jgi:hypothetical protein